MSAFLTPWKISGPWLSSCKGFEHNWHLTSRPSVFTCTVLTCKRSEITGTSQISEPRRQQLVSGDRDESRCP
jgi:hypothetical protein